MLNLTGIKNYKILFEKKIIFLSNLTKIKIIKLIMTYLFY